METESQARRMIRASFNPRAVTVGCEDFYRPLKGTLEEYVYAVVCASRLHAEWKLPHESSLAAVYVCVANYPVIGAIAAPCYAWVCKMLDVPYQSHVWWWVEYELKEGVMEETSWSSEVGASDAAATDMGKMDALEELSALVHHYSMGARLFQGYQRERSAGSLAVMRAALAAAKRECEGIATTQEVRDADDAA